MISPKIAVLFDGDCGICTATAQWVERNDRDDVFDVRPFQAFPEEELAQVGLNYEICTELLQVVSPDGRVFAGANAVNFVGLRLFPISIGVAALQFFPPLIWLEHLAYGVVARNRTIISQTLKMNACKVSF